jgi:hypothetical protein
MTAIASPVRNQPLRDAAAVAPNVFKAIAAAMSSTCPDVANQRPF